MCPFLVWLDAFDIGILYYVCYLTLHCSIFICTILLWFLHNSACYQTDCVKWDRIEQLSSEMAGHILIFMLKYFCKLFYICLINILSFYFFFTCRSWYLSDGYRSVFSFSGVKRHFDLSKSYIFFQQIVVNDFQGSLLLIIIFVAMIEFHQEYACDVSLCCAAFLTMDKRLLQHSVLGIGFA